MRIALRISALVVLMATASNPCLGQTVYLAAFSLYRSHADDCSALDTVVESGQNNVYITDLEMDHETRFGPHYLEVCTVCGTMTVHVPQFGFVLSNRPTGGGIDEAAPYLYWGETNAIMRSLLFIPTIETVVPSAGPGIKALAVDAAHNTVYWATTEGGSGRIRRRNLAEPSSNDFILNVDADDLAFDPIAGRLYWLNGAARKIERCYTDASGREDVVVNLTNATSIDLDKTTRQLFWNQGSTLYRANLESGGATSFCSLPVTPLNFVALDVPVTVSSRSWSTVKSLYR